MKDDQPICTVSAPSEAIDAGTAFEINVRIDRERRGDLGSAVVAIRDASGVELARVPLAETGDGALETGDIAISAPAVIGEHLFHAVVLAPDKRRMLQEVEAGACRVEVKSHAVHFNVWDVPPAIPAGESFELKIGVKCSAGCNLGGQRLRMVDEHSRMAGRPALGPEPWPGTDALYFATVEVIAPSAVGRHPWCVMADDWGTDLPHGAGSLDISVNTVPAPDCAVTITAVDSESRKPIAGATVVLHPYRATTSADGVARIKVPKGQYDAMVSGPRYLPHCTTITIEADMATTAELDADRTWASEDEQFG